MNNARIALHIKHKNIKEWKTYVRRKQVGEILDRVEFFVLLWFSYLVTWITNEEDNNFDAIYLDGSGSDLQLETQTNGDVTLTGESTVYNQVSNFMINMWRFLLKAYIEDRDLSLIMRRHKYMQTGIDYILFKPYDNIVDWKSRDFWTQDIRVVESLVNIRSLYLNYLPELGIKCEEKILSEDTDNNFVTVWTFTFPTNVDECLVTPVNIAPETLHEDLYHLYQKSILTDFTITVQDQIFHVHKNVLYVRGGNYFKKLLTCDLKEKLSSTLKLMDINPKLFKTYIDYVYLGVNIFNEVDDLDPLELYQLGHYFQQNDVVAISLNLINMNALPSDLSSLLEINKLYNDPHLTDIIETLKSI